MSQDDRLTGLVGYTGMKIPVRVATTAAITLSGEQTIDGVAVVADDRILVKDQASGVNNGIYVADTSTWSRAADCDGYYDLVYGSLVFVNSGSTNGGAVFKQTTTGTITIGTTSLAFSSMGLTSLPLAVTSGGTGAATAVGGLANLGVIQVTAESGTNTITGTIDALVTAYRADQLFLLVPAATNTGAATFNPTPSGGSALGAKSIFLRGSALIGGEMQISCPVILHYDGTQLNIVGNSASVPMNLMDNAVCDFRLSLTTGLAVTTTDVTAAGTIYAVPYKGNRIALFDGTYWNIRTSAEFSLALTATSGKPYDVFCYDNAGVPTLETLVWTNDTTRATALTTQNGVLVKTGAVTRRYLGSFYASGANTTEDSLAKRYLWNYYNRVPRAMRVIEATNTWTYTTATYRQANAATGNQLDYIVGFNEDMVTASVVAMASNGAAGTAMTVGIGVDSTSALGSGVVNTTVFSPVAAYLCNLHAEYRGLPGVGRHYLVWLEYSVAANTTTWYGDNGASILQAGISGEVLA